MSPAPTPWPPEATEPAVLHEDAPAPGTALPAHYIHCFGCGPDTANGLRMRTSVGDGLSVSARFVVTGGHQGAPGLAHGGLLAAAFDETLGSLAALLRVPAVTAKLETDFRRPVPVGSTLHITATVDGTVGRKIYESALGRLDAPDGPVAVVARALFVTVGMDHFMRHGEPDIVRDVFGAQAEFDVNP